MLSKIYCDNKQDICIKVYSQIRKLNTEVLTFESSESQFVGQLLLCGVGEVHGRDRSGSRLLHADRLPPHGGTMVAVTVVTQRGKDLRRPLEHTVRVDARLLAEKLRGHGRVAGEAFQHGRRGRGSRRGVHLGSFFPLSTASGQLLPASPLRGTCGEVAVEAARPLVGRGSDVIGCG